jgi:uncharacterized protein YdhG (YjbR/CyaY superfamily)
MKKVKSTATSATRTKQRGSEDIDAYLGALPENQRRALQRVRQAVRAAAPDAEEAFVYGVPGFRLDGKPLVCYAGFKHHCGFYPMSQDVIATHASEIRRHDVSKGTIRFEADRPLSASLVKNLVKARTAELKKS